MNLSSALDLRPRGRGGGQTLPAVPGNNNHIFNAHAKLTGKVDAGFDGDNHTRQKSLRLVRGDAGWFMNLEPHAVTGRVSKKLSQASFAQDASCGLVNPSAGHSRFDRIDGCQLSLPRSIIREALPVHWPPQVDGACHI